MEAHKPSDSPTDDVVTLDGEQFRRSALLEQLDRVVGSKHFRNSKRYPVLLRFVVEETLAGRAEGLKERTLGAYVFARPNDYDTNADPIVRVTAGEIRKRIAQYYQEPGHEQELRIELPLGAYVPHFFHAGAVHGMEESTARPGSMQDMAEASAEGADGLAIEADVREVLVRRPVARRFGVLPGVISGVVVLALLVLGWSVLHRRAESGLNYIWKPVFASSNPVLLVIGVHSFDGQGREEQPKSHVATPSDAEKDMLDSMVRSDMVPVSDIVSYSRLTDLLTRHGRTYATLGAADATMEQARSGPLVLIGGLDNLWTLRLTAKLRFHFRSPDQDRNEIVDGEHTERGWRFDNLQAATVNTQDYAIVASYFDTTIDQPVVIAAGIGKAGTQVAAEFVTSDQVLKSWMKEAGLPPNKNVEVVLSTEILDGKAGPPRVVASAAW